MKKKYIIFITGIILLMIAIFIFMPRNATAVDVRLESLSVGSILKTIETKGVLEALSDEEIIVPAGVMVSGVYAKEGQFVEKGQLLAKLETQDINYSLKKAEIAQSQLIDDIGVLNAYKSSSLYETLKNRYFSALEDMKNSKKKLDQAKDIRDNDGLSGDSLEAQKNIVSDLNNMYLKNKFSYYTARKDYMEQPTLNYNKTRQKNRELQSVRVDIRSLQSKLSDNQIKSSISGVITTFSLYEGRKSKLNDVIEISNMKEMSFRAFVPQVDSAILKKGQNAKITVKGFKDTLYGRVNFISRVAKKEAGSASSVPKVEVKISFESKQKLAIGFEADAVIEIGKLEKINVTKIENVKMEPGGKSFVFIEKDGKARRTYIETGLYDGVNFEVKSGLRTGDNVIFNPLQSISDGTQVRIGGKSE